jgi:hypothetical protein
MDIMDESEQAALEKLAAKNIAISPLDESPFASIAYVVAADLAKKEISHA